MNRSRRTRYLTGNTVASFFMGAALMTSLFMLGLSEPKQHAQSQGKIASHQPLYPGVVTGDQGGKAICANTELTGLTKESKRSAALKGSSQYSKSKKAIVLLLLGGVAQPFM